MIALVDANNFYASAEGFYNVKYRGKPLVVLSNNDGCVVARSKEAKELGIQMSEPKFKILHFVKSHGLIICSGNFQLYGELSNRMKSIINRYCDQTESYSVDESFIFGDGHSDFENKMLEMRNKIFTGLDLATSVGIAPTKTLSKVANKIVKKYSADLGHVYTIDSQEKIEKALKWFPIGDVWGIGRKYEKRFLNYGVKKAIDFVNLPDAFIKKEMGIYGIRMKNELLGIRQYDISFSEPNKQIATTRTFDTGTDDFDFIQERVVTFSAECSRKLRNQKSCCRHVTVYLTTNFFRPDQPQYSNSFTITLPNPYNSSIEIAKYAKIALNRVYKKGFQYKKAGVILSTFVPENERIISLYDDDLFPKHKPVMDAVDSINKKLGVPKVKLAGMNLVKTWIMKQEYLTSNEILTLRAY
ncbi:Y-family DNA polymerase [Chryseobacterium muglaense]|uniref:Y-family DNA polymerase n=1 Tax=Chryseobacterium muglaense TaxID=2893752 RepID=A0ABR8MCA9_9FLAO|nr:Y-family DNA polymerase [Chryseobacterium muglaense]MBD3906743.1 Y-family DNA polymerase [Chryseobacterium muglaense]